MSKYNEKLATQKYVEDEINKLAKIDGKIHVDAGNDFDTMEFPPGETLIYKLEDDYDLASRSGILIARWDYGYAIDGDEYIPSILYQTKIMVDDGEIWNRHSLAVDGNRATAWTEWEAVNASSKQFEELSLEVVELRGRLATQEINFKQDLSEVESDIGTLDNRLMLLDNITVIRNTVEGESIAMPDSTEAPLKGLKVMGKTEQVKTNGYQLFDVKSMDFSSQHSVSVSKLDNGAIRVTKTKIGSHLYASGKILNLVEFIDKTLYISSYVTASAEVAGGKNGISISYGNSTTGTTKSIKAAICDTTTTPTKLNLSITPTVADSENYDTIRIVLYENATSDLVGSVGDYVDFSDIMISTENVAFEPYTGGVPAPNVNYPQPLVSVGDDGSVDVHITSGNLMTDWIVGSARPSTGAITTDSMARRTDYIPVLPALGSLVASNFNGKLNSYMSFFDKDKVYISRTSSTPVSKYYATPIPTNAEYVILTMLQTLASTGTIEADVPDVMLEYGTTPTTYKPYEPIQTLNISTPNGLPAVPVSSNGNYTDESGQQWACDEIDYNRGVYIKRVGELEMTRCDYQAAPSNAVPYATIYNNDRKAGDGLPLMCTHYKWEGYNTTNGHIYTQKDKNGIVIRDSRFVDKDTTNEILATEKPKVVYELAEPTEITLSEEEIAAYKALHTHYPNTSIHNSDNAHMVVDYVADTKNYVDNQIKKEIAELKALVLEV